jgi:phosphodiesterase/alkaline phosphatase D-like protein
MRSRSRHTRWTLSALVCLVSCRVSHELDAIATEPSSAGSASPNSPAMEVQPTRDPLAETEVARCVRYRRQRAFEVAPGRRSPNGRHENALAVPTQDTGVIEAQLVVGAPGLAQGPILGAVTAESIKVWVRSDVAAAWSVRAWPKEEGEDATEALEVKGPPLTAASDFTGSLSISGLRPRTEYAYTVTLGAPSSDRTGEPTARGEFHTLAPDGEPTRTRLVVGADINGSGPQRIFSQIGDLKPEFMLFLGDQVYADTAEPTRDGYAAFYRHNWNIKHLRPMLQNVPAFMIWDDHEIEDNFSPGKSERYAPARAAYELYVQEHNPAPYRSDVLYYTLRSGDVAFFVLDERRYRSSDELPDEQSKTMLGARQKDDLVDWLTCESAKLKVIVSPVIWSDWAMTGDDAWSAFATEREELLGYIANADVGKVLFLSGDQHWSAVFRFLRDGYTFYEFLPTPLSKTRAVAPTAETDEILARDDDNFVFGVVDIDTTREPSAIALTLCASDKPCRPGEEPGPGTSFDVEGDSENVPFTIHLTGSDLGKPDHASGPGESVLPPG